MEAKISSWQTILQTGQIGWFVAGSALNLIAAGKA
jgi:hypothetical protein